MDATGLDFVPPTLPAGGCYLVFTLAAEGTLSTKFSHDHVPGAVAQFVPSKPVAEFKLKEAPRELVRGFRGVGRSNFFNGFCQFVSLAKKNGASVILLTSSVQLFIRMPSGELVQITSQAIVDPTLATAVVCFGKTNDSVKAGMSYMQEVLLRIGVSEGAGIAL